MIRGKSSLRSLCGRERTRACIRAQNFKNTNPIYSVKKKKQQLTNEDETFEEEEKEVKKTRAQQQQASK